MTVPSAIQAAMQQAVDDGVFPGAVLAVRVQSRLRYVAAVGRLSSAQDSPPTAASTVYDLASLTKPLATVTSIALLVQSSRLRLEDPAQDVLGELQGHAIGKSTVKDLLSHCSGLPGWRPLYERLEAAGLSPGRVRHSSIQQAVVQLICDEPLVYERGTKSLYSDLGFILLGVIIERVTGLPLDRWFDEAVAGPLRASPLLYCPAATGSGGSSPSLDRARIAPTEYDDWRKRLLQGEVHDENAAALGGVAGHAGLFGTAEAVLSVSGAWLRAYRGETSILRSEVARRFTVREQTVPQSTWALGWDTPSSPSSSGAHLLRESFGHLGYTGTSLWIDPQRNLEVVLLSNRVHPTRKNEKIRDFRPRIHDLVVQEVLEKG